MGYLTPKQRRFCWNVVMENMKHAPAYREAFGRPDMTAHRSGTLACRILKHDYVQAEMTRLRRLQEADYRKYVAVSDADRNQVVWNLLVEIVEAGINSNQLEVAIHGIVKAGMMGDCAQFRLPIPANQKERNDYHQRFTKYAFGKKPSLNELQMRLSQSRNTTVYATAFT